MRKPKVGRPTFWSGEATLAIEALLAAAGQPMSGAEVARGFEKGGKRIEQKVVKGLASLVLYGHVSAADADRFVVRRVA